LFVAGVVDGAHEVSAKGPGMILDGKPAASWVARGVHSLSAGGGWGGVRAGLAGGWAGEVNSAAGAAGTGQRVAEFTMG
jgi:hypothetical protein